MRRIVLCFDGTWNKPADESAASENRVQSNVRWFFESVEAVGPDGVEQIAWYNEGVGTHWYSELVGGAFGAGLDQHILDGYRFLVQTYRDGDEVYIVGFSRGAYTARSLVGMIRNCGVHTRRTPLGSEGGRCVEWLAQATTAVAATAA